MTTRGRPSLALAGLWVYCGDRAKGSGNKLVRWGEAGPFSKWVSNPMVSSVQIRSGRRLTLWMHAWMLAWHSVSASPPEKT
jgi:hypothetical protein